MSPCIMKKIIHSDVGDFLQITAWSDTFYNENKMSRVYVETQGFQHNVFASHEKLMMSSVNRKIAARWHNNTLVKI